LLSNECFPSQNTPKSTSAGASPQTPLGELIALPRTLAGFKGTASRRRGMEGREGKDQGREEEGKGGERGKLGE